VGFRSLFPVKVFSRPFISMEIKSFTLNCSNKIKKVDYILIKIRVKSR